MSHPSWVCGLKPLRKRKRTMKQASHPSWVCGLKLAKRLLSLQIQRHTLRGCVDWNWRIRWISASVSLSHPSWVCGLKLLSFSSSARWSRSHPSWVCGLKPFANLSTFARQRSHPSWVCGLKLSWTCENRMGCSVTPFVGVWIETHLVMILPLSAKSHTLRGCVDWNSVEAENEAWQWSHTLRGCVDWNNKVPALIVW